MQKFILTVLGFYAICINAADLESTTTFKPENCDTSRKTIAGDHLSMHYTGKIAESSKTGSKGKTFDSSIPRGEAFSFTLGKGEVIRGWDQGLTGMCVGEKRTLIIPPELGYGAQGAGADIPAGATLHFDVECVAIGQAPERPPQPNIFDEIDVNKDKKISEAEMSDWFQVKRGISTIPEGLWQNEDKDTDGFITWSEFSGPKGENDEL
eukprot:gene2842-5589_t